MFDLEAIDKWYEAGKECGSLIHFGLFDKRVLLPLERLPDSVKAETGETLTEDGILEKAAAGWFPLLDMEGPEETLGWPLYVPSRIGLLLKLEREGYRPEELRLIAELEEWAIDNLYSGDELAYLDDDLETLIQAAEERLEAFKRVEPEAFQYVEPKDPEGGIKADKELISLQHLKANGIPERLKPKIEKHAFRIRAWNEGLRAQLLEMDRDKIRAGYSPAVSHRGHRWSPKEGFRGEGLQWANTLRASMAYVAEGVVPTIRIPGWIMRGDQLTPTKTLRPMEYAAEWKTCNLDEYLREWNQLQGMRTCLHCMAPLTPTGNDRKRFCGERCRNAAKQKRFRENNPMGVVRAQERYWAPDKVAE